MGRVGRMKISSKGVTGEKNRAVAGAPHSLNAGATSVVGHKDNSKQEIYCDSNKQQIISLF